MGVDACDSADDAPDVHVEGRDHGPERRRRDRACRVRADPRQCLELLDRAWDLAVVVVPDTPGRLAECQRAAVIAEAGPCREQIARRCARQEIRRRPGVHEAASHAGPTRSIPVCCDITSATRIPHGVRAWRITSGRSAVACQVKRRSEKPRPVDRHGLCGLAQAATRHAPRSDIDRRAHFDGRSARASIARPARMVVLDEPCSRVGYAAADMNQTDTQSPGKLDGEGRREPPLPADDPADLRDRPSRSARTTGRPAPTCRRSRPRR